MNTYLRILIFLQYFALGAWLLSAGSFMNLTLGFSALETSAVYGTMGISALFFPALAGLVADHWIDARKLLSVCHFVLALHCFYLPNLNEFKPFYVAFFCVSAAYMPTFALSSSIVYHVLEKQTAASAGKYPTIRGFGTLGFIGAAWCVDFLDWKSSSNQFYLSGAASFLVALWVFVLPAVPCSKKIGNTWKERLGLNAIDLLKRRRVVVFLIFSALVGAVLQATNIWGVPFLGDFGSFDPDSFVSKNSVILLSLSQISEAVFIFTIPFFMRIWGVKQILIVGMIAWVLRFTLFALGGTNGLGLSALVVSMLVYGVAFDFFFVSGSMFINGEATAKTRASAQGLFIVMVSGVGSLLGSYGSGYVVDLVTFNEIRNWQMIWGVTAGYSLLLAILFPLIFRPNANPL